MQWLKEVRFGATANPPYLALRVLLGFLSLCMAIGGVVLIFSSKALILRLFLHPPEAEVSSLFLFTLKEMGGFALMLAVMVFFAARDPVRNGSRRAISETVIRHEKSSRDCWPKGTSSGDNGSSE